MSKTPSPSSAPPPARSVLAGRAAGVLRALLVVAVLAGGAFAIAVRDADPSWWAFPIRPGALVDGWRVVDVQRTASHVHLTLDHAGERASVKVEHRPTAPAPAPLRFAGRYRVDPQAGQPTPDAAALDAIAAQIEAWEASTPAPPAFVRPPGDAPQPWQPTERRVLDAALIVGLAGLVGLGGRLRDLLRPVAFATWIEALAIAGGFTALVRHFGTAGVWHANAHGWDRAADLAHHTPPWNASLGLLHGFGFYTLMDPLVAGGPDGGRDVFDVATAVTFAALLLWFVALRLFLGEDRRALVALAALAWSPLLLRVGPTEAMYVPALLYAGALALAVEALICTGDAVFLVAAAPSLVLVMDTRADLLVLAPAAVLLRLGSAGALSALLRRWPVWATALLVAASQVPRALTFAAVDKATGTGRSLFDPWRDPRSALLLTVLALAALAWPPIARRLPSPRPTARWIALAVGGLAGAGALVAWRFRPDGYAPSPQVHPMLDPDWTAPWLIASALVGLLLQRRRAPAQFTFVAGGAAAALLVYLGRYDCLSTYSATALATAPLIAILLSEGVVGLLELVTLRDPVILTVAAAVLGTGTYARADLLRTRFPKQQQWDELQTALALLDDRALVWPADDDLPAELASRHLRPDRMDLPRYVGDRVRLMSVRAWEAAPVEAVFLLSTDCYRPILSRGGPPVAWTGAWTTWSYLHTPVASTAPRYAVDGLSDEQPFSFAECDRMLAGGAVLHQTPLTAATSGSIYEEVRGARPVIGVVAVRPDR